MKNLFQFYNSESNVGGDPTDVTVCKLRRHSMFQLGDRIVCKYLIVSSVSSFSVQFNIAGNTFTPNNLIEGNNYLEVELMLGLVSNSDASLIYAKLTNESSLNDSFIQTDSIENDVTVKLTIQDTSGSPADGTVVVKFGSIVSIPVF